MLSVVVRLMMNPWDHTIPNNELFGMLMSVGESRAAHIEKMHERGEWPRNSLGLAFLNPAAPLWQPTPETLLATIAIGPEGERFIVNAVAKAAYHRDHGVPAGYGVYMDLSRSRDGDFCYGFSEEVSGLIAGASAQTEMQDACEAGHAAVTLLYYLRKARADWKVVAEDPHWFDDEDRPSAMYTRMAYETQPLQTDAAEG
jgi:hypothetical protein